MRSARLAIIFLAFYLVFLGGSAYYNLILPVRFFHHALITALLGIWFWRRWRGEGLPRTALDAPLAAAVGVWFVTALTSLDPRMAFEHLWFVLMHVAFFYVLVDYFQRGRGKLIMEAVFIIAALVVVITLFEVASWYFGLGVVPGTEVGWFGTRLIPLELPRVALALNISTLLAGFVAPLIPLTLGWAVTVRRDDYRKVLYLLAGGLLITLILTFSRGGLISLGTAMTVLVVFQVIRRRQIPTWIYITGGVVALAGIAAFFVISQGRSSGDQVRLDMYEGAVEIMADYPLTGVGPGQYGRAFREYRTPFLARDKLASAHNAPLNTAAESGLLGLAVSAWLAGALVWAAFRTWQNQNTPGRKLRVEATIAGLAGVAAHSLVDVFTVTPVVLVILLLAAYSITGHRTVLDARPAGRKWPLPLALAVTLGYGVFLLQADRAQSAYQNSFTGDLASAQQAEALDPALNLYDLQIAYLTGLESDRDAAIAAYERALELEPTWDVGWVNLGYLYWQAGDVETSLAHIRQAIAINPLQPYELILAEWLESAGAADDETIIALYSSGLRRAGRLPLHPYYVETPLRRAAIAQSITRNDDPERRMRIALALMPELAADLLPETPETAAHYYMLGDYALTVEQDAQTAREHFTRAIEHDPTNGDYYAARARASLTSDPDAARDDLDYADLLRTPDDYEQLANIRTILAGDSITVAERVITQDFAAVLYGSRIAQFNLFDAVQAPPRLFLEAVER
jgi:tetratricopeptide (TPR) repeat protein/O-antigen ligase